MFQRYLPGLDASQLSEDDYIRKYGMLMYILEQEGIKNIKLATLGSLG